MGLSVYCVLFLFVTFAVALDDYREQSRDAEQSVFVRKSGFRRVLRSLPERPAQQLKINRRDLGDLGDTCKALQGHDTELDDNTHSHIFNDLSGTVSLAWVGDGTGVILALTTFQLPFFMIKFGQSKLYRSKDYGKTFSDVTELINNTFIRTEFGIAIGPDNSGKVIMTGDVSGGKGSRIFTSTDFGNSFFPHDLPFNPLTPITYNPRDSNVLVVTGNHNQLWLSKDFGASWEKIHDMVCMVKWGPENAIFFTSQPNGSCFDRGMLELKRTTDYGKTIKSVAKNIFSFGLGGRFLFASVMTGKGTLRRIHVSVDHGEVWNIAQLPPVGHEEFYSILAANNDMVFMHVDEPGDTGFGTIYASDDRGIVYSKSLERHLYTTTGGDTDFTNVTSLRGVFITSTLAEDSSVQSVVSFDQGGEWLPLLKPLDSKCDVTAKDPEKCSLHIHAAYSTAMRIDIPMLPLSEPNAVGLIIAHGSVGDSISAMKPDVYISDDGGYSWFRALKGPHHYAILDSGACWWPWNTAPPRPSTRSSFLRTRVSAGACTTSPRSPSTSPAWRGDVDYVQWLAHSDDISDPSDGCMLGYKEKFRRLKKDSVCRNGRQYEVNPDPTPCLCTLDDYLCDFGYFRKENSSVCLEQADLKGRDLEFCVHGEEEKLKTSGYRRIPGDKCEGGAMPQRKEIDLHTRCVSDMAGQKLEVLKSSSSVAIIITVAIVMLLSIAAGVLFIKKYVCGGRFLVHRYSVLQQHAEANGLDGDEPLETSHTPNGKIEFHDDSDEDLLE
ncbi:hypothetical protein NHX12_013374 [Muraenolepis orangiensis]|uniref:Sortilin n=1 Tax=Muraenolepis orangiensis TaxID=630683 RepID=A0A9Q0DG97_9TELE|nr:hypothetical protein NHX12_013374 [Muraenolepis orangiensis]